MAKSRRVTYGSFGYERWSAGALGWRPAPTGRHLPIDVCRCVTAPSQVMDRQSMLVGIVVGVMFGVTFEKFARARRDFRSSKRFAAAAGRSFRLHHLPRMLVIGFVCGCAGVAAFRLVDLGG